VSGAQLWALIGLGIFHGANPGMGWLLAVSRGLQEGGRGALLRSLPVLAAGHAASVAAVAVVITATGSLTASRWVPAAGGALLAAAGLWLLLARAHVHRTDVRMSLPQLGVWSFLMASVHGAGLMLLPVLSGDLGPEGGGAAGRGGHHAHAPAPAPAAAQAEPAAAAPSWELFDTTLVGLAATAVHTAAMFAATGVVALIAYDFLGVHAMRLRWVTMDRVWAFALLAGGAFVLWSAF